MVLMSGLKMSPFPDADVVPEPGKAGSQSGLVAHWVLGGGGTYETTQLSYFSKAFSNAMYSAIKLAFVAVATGFCHKIDVGAVV